MKKRGLLAHIVLIIALGILFFWKLIPNLNHIYFSRGGDGFRTYFGMYYHAKYDSTYFRLDGMNYPFGEMMDFTDCQPPVSNFIRFVSRNFIDITGYTTGIINGLMLFSIILASIFIFLILKRMKLPDWYSSIVAVIMVFLSPQIQRMGGHFSLSWMFWVPLSIYLLMVFDQKRSYLYSVMICVFAIIAGAMHFYFLAFWLFLFGPYWLYRWLWHRNYKFQKSDLLHFFIQVVLPLLILQFNLILHDVVTDRTANPWGFYAYRGHFAAVFLPLFKSYVPFLGNLSFAKKFDWEAFCYIGIVASIGFFVLFFQWINTSLKTKKVALLSGDQFSDFLFWISFFVLLFSFGLPFTLGLDKLRQFLGPLGQLRGIARFGWMFYFVINIIVFKKIYNVFFEGNGIRIWKKVLVFLFLGVFAFEAWSYSGKSQDWYNNTVTELDGKGGINMGDFCKTNINSSEYQAVLPLPYFHIGSESIWLEPKCDILKLSFIVSMETGLPNIGVAAARTSISQSYKNIELVTTPWKKYRVTENYPNKKSILLTVANCEELKDDEKRLIQNAIFIGEHQNLKFYKLPFDSLEVIPEKYDYTKRYQDLIESIDLKKDSIKEGYLCRTGNLNNTGKSLKGDFVTSDFKRIMEAPVKLEKAKQCYLRFWVKDYDHDMVARTSLLVFQSTPEQKTLEEKYTDIFRYIRALNNDWALIEVPLEVKQSDEIIKLLIKNPILNGKQLYFDEFSVSQVEL
jgi:hypothetical protein